MGRSLRNWASHTWGEEVASLHRIPSVIQSNSSANLLLMKDGNSDPTAARSLVDQQSSNSDVAADSGWLVDWIFDMVRRFHFQWSGMLRVIPLATVSQLDAELLHFGGDPYRRSWEAPFYSLPIWWVSYIIFSLSLGMYRRDWPWLVSLAWQLVILLILFAGGPSLATHTVNVISRENLSMGTVVTGGGSFCSARWL